jgi:hypothetical protein
LRFGLISGEVVWPGHVHWILGQPDEYRGHSRVDDAPEGETLGDADEEGGEEDRRRVLAVGVVRGMGV